MKGKIEIICDEKGTHLSVNITETVEHDNVFLVHALGKSLGLNPHDYMVLAMAEAEGVLDGVPQPVLITIDTDELHKQLEEEMHES